jgi:hypothetical protein
MPSANGLRWGVAKSSLRPRRLRSPVSGSGATCTCHGVQTYIVRGADARYCGGVKVSCNRRANCSGV